MSTDFSLAAALRADRDAAPRVPYAWLARRDLPDDVQARLVWADALLACGDVRGEQLMLEYAVEHLAHPTWREDAERLLALVCERGFVCVPDDPDAALLPWSNRVVPYFEAHTLRCEHEQRVYTLAFRRCLLTLHEGARCAFSGAVQLDWTDAEINLCLHAASEAIRRGKPSKMRLPERDDPRLRPGPYPRYRVPLGGTVAARDISRWNAIYRRVVS